MKELDIIEDEVIDILIRFLMEIKKPLKELKQSLREKLFAVLLY